MYAPEQHRLVLPSLSHVVVHIVRQLKDVWQQRDLPGVVSLYSAAYSCKTGSVFDETYLCGFTTASVDRKLDGGKMSPGQVEG